MRKVVASLAVLGALALGGQSFALIGTIDNVPAATLLVPYFEVDPANQSGLTTLFSINNASATAILAHVTVWSDQSIPVLDFDVYLTGYDVQTINLRDVLVNGVLPQTASDGQDPNDTISPQGPVSQDINFASCSGVLPPGPLGAGFRSHLLGWLTGVASPITGDCAGSKTGDGIMRGYVTIDAVNACNKFFPSDGPQYLPFLTSQNVLWGDVIYVNPSQNFATGQAAVHIEASVLASTALPPGTHTFYGRYNLANASDLREALPTTMASRYVNGGGFSGGTNLIVWREANASATSYACTRQGPASWYPLGSTQIALFDEQEHTVTTQPCQSGDPTCTTTIEIPNETQRVSVKNDLLSPFDFGWVYLNLQHSGLVYADSFAQMWLIANMTASGQYEVDIDGVQLDNARTPITTIIPIP